MVVWNPGPSPFPHGRIDKISDFRYLDELHFVRHAQVHLDKTPRSLWQLAADFRVSMIVYPETRRPYALTITAPRGLYTDLASVPKLLWSMVGPIGRHLEASIVHDYLYMSWTDFKSKAVPSDWAFADQVFKAGMRKSKAPRRGLIYRAVHSPIGWRVFRKKSYTLQNRMEAWLPDLEAGHIRRAQRKEPS